MHKDNLDERLMGKKAYFTSRNLDRPEIVYEDMEIKDCFEKYNLNNENMVYSNKFMSKENGMVNYFEFNKKRNNLIQGNNFCI